VLSYGEIPSTLNVQAIGSVEMGDVVDEANAVAGGRG
jgi:hypothetical protein